MSTLQEKGADFNTPPPSKKKPRLKCTEENVQIKKYMAPPRLRDLLITDVIILSNLQQMWTEVTLTTYLIMPI